MAKSKKPQTGKAKVISGSKSFEFDFNIYQGNKGHIFMAFTDSKYFKLSLPQVESLPFQVQDLEEFDSALFAQAYLSQ